LMLMENLHEAITICPARSAGCADVRCDSRTYITIYGLGLATFGPIPVPHKQSCGETCHMTEGSVSPSLPWNKECLERSETDLGRGGARLLVRMVCKRSTSQSRLFCGQSHWLCQEVRNNRSQDMGWGGEGGGPQSLTRKYDSNFLGLSECSAGILVEFSALLHCFKQFMPYLSLTALFLVNKFCPESTKLPFHGHILYYHNGRMACVFDINVPSQTWQIKT
jgi:hypothetical protein